MKKTDPREYFTTYLRNNKFRITPERFQILDTVMGCEGHFDADDLFLKMKKTAINNEIKRMRTSIYLKI